MSNLTVFNFESNEVRFVDGLPVANDVAKVLGYKNPSDAIYRIVNDKNKGVCDLQTPGGIQSVTVLKEPGIYQLIFSSKLESAVKFQEWVFEEVLPTIRKTGSYITNSDEILLMLKSQAEALINLQKQNELILAAKTEAEIMGNAVQTEFAGLSRLINAKLGAVSDHFADRINQMFQHDEFNYFTLKQVCDFFLPLVAEDKEKVLFKARCNINGIYRNLTGRYLPVNNMTYVFGKDEILFVLWKLTMAAEDLGVKLGLSFTVKKVTQELEKMLEF